ncbi:leucine--tRNA ligase [Candidatus Peregrinibacteria bacterium]|nr:leucine--tRNA ligase [Candidatus Peregrinibacteria bacterium]
MYLPSKIEPKWQEYWLKNKTFKAPDASKKQKYYVLDMFPYPSGAGLHVGHPEGYTATDIVSRTLRMKGLNVLHPMGWDAFGLPAENYAIKTKVHPRKTTEESIQQFRTQIRSIGFSYDWDRDVATCSPEYYRWTQWFFLFLYKNGLAYKKKAPVNWCESCKTVLANEQVVNGACERCHNAVIQKELEQWFFKITDFIEDTEREGRKTDGLLTGLGKIDWPNGTLVAQRNWIGRSEGITITYPIEGVTQTVSVFTTRPDTNFGATFIVAAPDSEFVKKYLKDFPKQNEVATYVKAASHKSELERIAEGRQKTGVFTGWHAINHLTGRTMPIYVTDFVLANVGTGVVVGVPGHDLRDFKFAQAMKLDIVRVVKGPDGDTSIITQASQVQEEAGTMVNSDFLNGLDIHAATTKIMDHIEAKGWGKRVIHYKLRDWLVSRQRYWGAPIPIVYCPDCGELPVSEKDLPVELPDDVDFMPTGESPLIHSKKFHAVICPKCGKPARRESDTMDTFVCSSWYFFRFMDPQNAKAFASKKFLNQWGPIDLYVGGAEHTVLHLLYARFFTKALHRYGFIDYDEPFLTLRHQGIILGEDNEKMSKSRGNVVNPDDVIKTYGADTLRLYEMFMGPFNQMKPWSTKNIEGVYRFLKKAWFLFEGKVVVDSDDVLNEAQVRLLHKTIKKVTEDIEHFSFNTAISQLMIFINEVNGLTQLPRKAMESFVLILSPFAPHLAEELWAMLGHKKTLAYETWPTFDPALVKDEVFELVISINGKPRDWIQATVGIAQEEAIKQALGSEKIQRFIEGKKVIKQIYVPGKLVNIVTSDQ